MNTPGMVEKEHKSERKGTSGKSGMKQNEQPDIERTLRFLKRQFRGYYSNADIPSQPRLSLREAAFTFFDRDFMLRHVAFKRHPELTAFLRQRAPANVYLSSAYYRHPDAGRMSEKDWLGADLIFDLDADHIEGAEKMSYEAMLERVKEEFLKLIYDFLLDDFGFKEKDVQVVFSGARGYHIHIHRQDVLGLKSHERREIVDYITGRGLDVEGFVEKRAIDMKNPDFRFSKVNYTYRLPSMDEPGWRGKITRGVVEVASSFKDRKEAIKRITKLKGVGKKTAGTLLSELFDTPTGREKFEALKQGTVDVFSSDRVLKAFLRLALQEAAINLSGETDEPVTSDIKRLIRMPGSLHGKTGFRVVPLTLKKLEDFDPLVDAVVLPESLTKVRLVKDIEGRVGDEVFSYKKGDVDMVPGFLAVFLAGRKSGVVV